MRTVILQIVLICSIISLMNREVIKMDYKIKNYKIVCVDNKKVGCMLLKTKNDGVLLDEIYLEENYRNKGIGSNIINKIISENNIIYLWVYKLNIRAISLYRRLGFKVIQEDENRYYMKFDSTLI